MGCFRVCLNYIDHYQAVPNEFDPLLPALGNSTKGNPNLVPVIRVFGATPAGQKVCVHVHGAFPYLYAEYHGSLQPPEVGEYVRSLRESIDHALAVSYRRDLTKGNNAFVAHVSLVKGIPFYGYHVGYRFYLKIYLLNPLYINRLSDLMLQGAILARLMQPYESHMQYVPQWMCDNNLFGCDYMDSAKIKFRQPVPEYDSRSDDAHQWHDRNIPSELISYQDKLQRQSHCPIEVDICVQDILNRKNAKSRDIHHDFVEKVNPLNQDEKLVTSMAGLWRDETRRRKARLGMTDSDSSPFPPEALISVSADPRNNQPGGWVHEDEYRAQMLGLILSERENDRAKKVNFTEFVEPNGLEGSVQTAFESIEELHTVQTSHSTFGLNETIDPVPAHSSEPTEDGEESVHSYADSYTRECDEDEFYRDVLSQFERGQVDGESGSHEAVSKDRGKIRSGNLRGKSLRDMPTKAREFADVPSSQEDSTLEGMGIRDFGDYDYGHEDAFEIPAPCMSKIDFVAGGEPNAANYSNTAKKSSNDMLVPTSYDASPLGKLYRRSQGTEKNMRQKRSMESEKTHEHDTEDLLGASLLATNPSEAQEQNTSDQSAVLSGPILIMSRLPESFNLPSRSRYVYFGVEPPSASLVEKEVQTQGISSAVYQAPYYSNEDDVPKRAREYGGKTFRLKGDEIRDLPEFDATGKASGIQKERGAMPTALINPAGNIDDRLEPTLLYTWEIEELAPNREEVQQWLAQVEGPHGPMKDISTKLQNELSSQIDGPTQKNSLGAKASQQKAALAQRDVQYMSVMSLEVHVNTRGNLVPNPEKDEISCIFWCLQSEDERLDSEGAQEGIQSGVIIMSEPGDSRLEKSHKNLEIDEESSELDLLNKLIDIVRYLDPDILTGFEVHGGSWGFVIERARLKYSFDVCDELSRVMSQSHSRFGKASDRWGFEQTSTIRITGRHMINIWRAMRGELNLLQYTIENVAYHVLRRRVPHYPFSVLTAWYNDKEPRNIDKLIKYFVSRTRLDLEILERNELIPRTCEQARLLGVDFSSVFSRGSQFKVESLMFRIAKLESLMLISPSRKQVGQQNSLECLPLVMEPQSAFYTSPVLVLDFQSLYPSIMIAYNYCYSTYLGRCIPWRGGNKMGFTEYPREPRLLELLQEHINVAPNGIMYVKPLIRKSLLAKMLCEILETRVMVKSGMKEEKENRPLQRLLNNRQLALKLIANVTYGYTSASFSGRMPCSEIADSIVQTARETLEKAIALIHSVERWGAEVVYGDTDSLFIHLKGRTRDQAFQIGNEISQAVTDINPRPIKLKFEKVYHPCVLLAKKRYVGFKYETRAQREPEFDAKGIETVRRDGTPAEQKIEEAALKILFRTADLSEVKAYFQAQCTKIMKGKVSIQDFCFAREVKLGTYRDKGPPPPGALISTRRLLEDPRAEAQYGERVPYVVVTGAPGARLIDRCVAPEELLYNDRYGLDTEYYIGKNLIPPLERIFNLVGASVSQWYAEMPKYKRLRRPAPAQPGAAPPKRRTIESYMQSSECYLCRARLAGKLRLCARCRGRRRVASLVQLRAELNGEQARAASLAAACRSCAGLAFGEEIRCDSKDCPVFYSRVKQAASLAGAEAEVLPLIELLERGALEW